MTERRRQPRPGAAEGGFLVAHGPALANHPCLRQLPAERCRCLRVGRPSDLDDARELSALILDPDLCRSADDAEAWRRAAGNALIVANEPAGDHGDVVVPESWPVVALRKALETAFRQHTLRRQARDMRNAWNAHQDQLHQLTGVGVALSAEKDHDRLLERILSEARRLAGCDAASLYLVEDGGEEDGEHRDGALVFKLAQNESVDFRAGESRLPIDETSIAGYVTIHGTEVNLDDVYDIGDAPYTFNKSFDEQYGYRTTSMLALPMRTPQGDTVGVLQFINRKRNQETLLRGPQQTLDETLPFTEDINPVLRALASQAAVAIANNRLLRAIENMFEGFVRASVTAIEQRDPTTSGHSFRVATLTTGLADMLPRSGLSRFRDVNFGDREMRELRYAALLHDFGKVGVRENVLLKPKKLPEQQYDRIRHRIELERERLKQRALEQQLMLYRSGNADPDRESAVMAELERELARLERYWEAIRQANEPRILPEEGAEELHEIRNWRLPVSQSPLIGDEEFRILSIPKGSLTDTERREIESHVTHTFNFLRRIPWPDELKNVPDIAAAHHEKLDGRGYPFGLADEEIPFPSKLMTVSDIYDALTAKDRPYKKAMPAERALSILEEEAKSGHIDGDLVRIFIEADVFRLSESV